MDFDQERTIKLYQELAEAREKIASLTAYAERLKALLVEAKAVLEDHDTYDVPDGIGGMNHDVYEMHRRIHAALAAEGEGR